MTTNTSMSVFNRTKTDEVSSTKSVRYKKHVVENVFWDSIQEITNSTGFEKNNKVDVFIPFDKNDMSEYVEPKQYNGTGWTLRKGDFIIKGDVEETEVDGIKDLSAYEVFEITTVDVKDFGSYNMQHFEIKGK